jgi:hypothetical protein
MPSINLAWSGLSFTSIPWVELQEYHSCPLLGFYGTGFSQLYAINMRIYLTGDKGYSNPSGVFFNIYNDNTISGTWNGFTYNWFITGAYSFQSACFQSGISGLNTIEQYVPLDFFVT